MGNIKIMDRILKQIEFTIQFYNQKKHKNFSFENMICPQCNSHNITLCLEINLNLETKKQFFDMKNLKDIVAICDNCSLSNSLLEFIQGKIDEEELIIGETQVKDDL